MKLLNIVKALEGAPRRTARQKLRKLFAPFGVKEEHYATGVNLVMRKPGKPQILLAAHYDTFPGCPGANDNFSGIAVLYGIAQELWKKNLPYGLTLCIFDEEELNCLGSYAYVQKHGIKDIKAVIDLELVGMGNVVGLWPVTKKTPLVSVFESVLQKRKQQYETIGKLAYFWADYQPFKEQGVDSVCVTLIEKRDVKLMRDFLALNTVMLAAKYVFRTLKLPHFFQAYHTEHDTSAELNEKSLQLTKHIILDVLKEYAAARI